MENIIEVVIPKQIFFLNKYLNNSDCYLAVALKKAGYDVKRVFSAGKVLIGDTYYVPVRPFDNEVVRVAFGWGKNIPVTLKRVS